MGILVRRKVEGKSAHKRHGLMLHAAAPGKLAVSVAIFKKRIFAKFLSKQMVNILKMAGHYLAGWSRILWQNIIAHQQRIAKLVGKTVVKIFVLRQRNSN